MTDKRPSGPHNPRNRLTDAEARTVRNWIFGSAAAALLATGLPLNDDPQLAKAVTIVLAATFVTGAITVRRPFGVRLILAGAAAGAFMQLISILSGRL